MYHRPLGKYGFTTFCLILLMNVGLSAKEIHVYPNRPESIQSAIDESVSGDKIILHKGDYYETLTLVKKSNITIQAAGDGSVRIYGVMKEFTDPSIKNWNFIRKEKNDFFKNTQWIYEAVIPEKYRKINHSLPDYWSYRNNIYFGEQDMLWSYDEIASFNNRIIDGTDGQGAFFGKNKILIALNMPIEKKSNRQYVTYSGQVLAMGKLSNVIIDGGKDKQIEFLYAGRYCISVGGMLDNVTFKNIRITNPINAFYFLQCTGQNVTIEGCMIKKNLPFDCLWIDTKRSKSMEGTGIIYATGDLKNVLIKNNIIEGFFNGIAVSPGNTIIENNYLKNIGDDAIELEGPAVNTIVRNNFIKNCFVSFSLTPVEEGPVFIYDNFVFSDVESFPYQYQKDGSIRYKEPRLIKFTNLVNGEKLKNGEMMKVSGNVHFYYNTLISRKIPFTVGSYNKKEYSPVQSTFYNNIFVSEGVLTNSTGFSEDGIDVDNNVFFSSFKDKSDDRLFIGWNGSNHYKTLKNDNEWSENQFLKLNYEIKKGKFHWCRKSQKALSKVPCKKLPPEYPDAQQLNQRDKPGATFKK
jgi:parallel beta helix pectate lyase-like protein